ncbi:SulP family inorganic anion transporter [Victivallis sp. Marseille-Q1083]|uniref:SulP family inorganic anion transporter n=1 Tax=Victivallis sp. Marseille-Q1083 TaxID=2717288 RepID=UPI00158878E3|nr:SulP family inorganic anion transporter [Victivallis sp. Marseille-Q1083]
MFHPYSFSELKSYSWQKFSSDLFAGVTVGVVALPLAMAFAIASGFSPERGIYTAIVAGFLISLFGGSKVQIGGPTGAFIVIISSIYLKFGDAGLLMATLLAGVILVLFGLCHMGALIKFIPFPVTTGFTSGIAVVIFMTQVNDLLGLKLTGLPADMWGRVGCYAANFHRIDWPTVAVSSSTILVIVLVRRFLPRWPAMLIGMLAATVLATGCGLEVETIGSRFGALPRTLPEPALAFPDWSTLLQLIMPAFTIALLAGIESLLSATVADGMTGDRHRPNTELIAQGLGNIGAVLFNGIPATGAIARTATNIKSGGRTPVAGMIHAVTLAGILLLLAPQAGMIPLASLAGIMMVVCYNMSEYHTFLRMFRGPKSDWVVMLTTFLLTVLVDLVAAVEVGVVLAALLFIRRMAEIANVSAITGELGTDKLSDPDDPDAIAGREVPEHVVVFEVQGPFFFGAVDEFKDAVMAVFHRESRVIILRMRQVPAIDATGLNVLADFLKQCRKDNIILILSGVRPDSQPMCALAHYGLSEGIGADNICPHIDKALERARILLKELPAGRRA